MTSWLTHKCAQFARSVAGGAVVVVGSVSAGFIGVYDLVTEDVDHLDGNARVQTVQAFEKQIDAISELKVEQDNLVATREQSYLTGNMAEAKGFDSEIKAVSGNISNKINALDNALYLTTVIGENDFERLAGIANSKFALDASVDGAAFLHECQLKTSSMSRDEQKETVEKCMVQGAEDDITETNVVALLGTVMMSLFMSIGAIGIIQHSSSIHWAASSTPEPSKLLQKIQKANANRRQRRNQKKLEN